MIIAEDVEGEALATLVVNKIRGTFNSVAVKAPGFGERRKAMLQDMAALTGGQVITEEVGLKLDSATLDLLGSADKVIITKDETTIVGGQGPKADVDGRIAQIKKEIENTDSDWDREKLQERLAKLSGGVAVVKVGAATEVELKEKKHRIEDAVSATKAAIDEGVVPGGGTALLRSRSAIETVIAKLEGDEATGARIVFAAVEAPARCIAENAGESGAVVVERVLGEKKPNVGYNAATGDLRGPGQGRRHRPGQGHPGGAAERGVDRRAPAHHRGRRGRQARASVRSSRHASGRRWHGRHGGHGLLAVSSANRRFADEILFGDGLRPSRRGPDRRSRIGAPLRGAPPHTPAARSATTSLVTGVWVRGLGRFEKFLHELGELLGFGVAQGFHGFGGGGQDLEGAFLGGFAAGRERHQLDPSIVVGDLPGDVAGPSSASTSAVTQDASHFIRVGQVAHRRRIARASRPRSSLSAPGWGSPAASHASWNRSCCSSLMKRSAMVRHAARASSSRPTCAAYDNLQCQTTFELT